MEGSSEMTDSQKSALPLVHMVLSKLHSIQNEFSIQNRSMPTKNNLLLPINNPIIPEYVHVESENEMLSTLPLDFTQISQLNKRCVIAYIVLFIFAAVGNLWVLYSIFPRKTVRKTRISFLITNLCVADLIVTFFLMPTEIFWRITIAWEGGDVLCKMTQFVRAFGLYLSANVVICISIDRYFSIVHPLKMGGAAWRVKFTLVGAWIASTAFAGPQIFVYHVAQHPVYPEFHQCVTKAFLTKGPYNELIYNIVSVAALYFIPLLVVIYTYTMILWKLYRKSKEQRVTNTEQETSSSSPGTVTNTAFFPSRIQTLYRKLSNSSAENDSTKTRIILRCSENHRSTLNRACSRTLKLTLLILLTFIVCWTPYVVITLWYMLDRSGASQVDERLQEALFIMTMANSVINPFIYGTVGRRQTKRRKHRVPVIPFSTVRPNLTCCHYKGVPLIRKGNTDLTIQNNVNRRMSKGIHTVTLRNKMANFDTVLGFNQEIKRGTLGWQNNHFITSDRITI